MIPKARAGKQLPLLDGNVVGLSVRLPSSECGKLRGELRDPHLNRNPSKYKIRALLGVLVASLALLCLSMSSRPAYAIAGGPEGALASLIIYDICLAFGRPMESCAGALADPQGEITNLHIVYSYNPDKISVSSNPTPYFFSDLSNGGPSPPVLQLSSIAPPADSDAIFSTPFGPRPGTTATFTNNTSSHLLTLDYDLSANPTTSTDARNVFGFRFDVVVPFNAVQYFSTSGNYDLSVQSFSCAPLGCGSNNPVAGVNFLLVSEPSSFSFMLLSLGLALVAGLASGRLGR
jgi:hypothetical protein